MEPWWQPALQEVFEGRDVVIAGGVPASWVDYVDHIWAAGAHRVMIVATEGVGVGRGPDVPTVVAEPPAGLSIMERLRWSNRVTERPPDEIRKALDEFDPDHTAIVVGSFLNEAPTLDGRPFLAHRRAEWVALEDKTVIDAFWDRAGVARQPSLVVELDQAATDSVSLDRGSGTVWAADARDGFHGGAHATHWVAGEASQVRAIDALRPVCDRVRVMPFVEGVPCSIHGIVLTDGDVVLRPVEMVTLRRGNDLVYAGCATFWDPPGEIREQMRSIARLAAAQLRDEVGFRGTFTIDGVAAADGFWPTELNPRFGAGINVIARAEGNVPILLLHDLAVAGRSIGLPASEAERQLLEHADAHRSGGTWRWTSPETTSAEKVPVRYSHGDWLPADGSPADGSVNAGPSFARCLFEPDSTPVGLSVGARAVAFWRFADRHLATGLGDLTPATDPFA